ncbi:MAG: MFS transporter [Deltaproteobacteria bacterium]|nr:MFS transporter [Deltaproteobacteria bacterium]
MIKLQLVVFALVSASFTNIYITQPILPVLQDEFGVTTVQVSLTVSVVILGIVISNLFFGFLSDRISIRPIILTGGFCVAIGGLISALTHDFKILIAARLFQGLFIPALTTSLLAWLARTLPGKRLAVVMGSYVSATILGGLGGRLLGGWIHPYRLSNAPFYFSTELITLIYFVSVVGIFLGPIAGLISNRFGSGNTMIVGTSVLGVSFVLLLIPSIIAVIFGLLGVCVGFFTIHVVAVGLLNQKLTNSHGKANALYAVFYYAGGWLGITGAGFVFQEMGWKGVVFFVMCFLVIPILTGLFEKRAGSA